MSTSPSRGTIGIIGAGKSGVAIARLALAAGYTVNIASSGPATETKMMVDIVAPGATAVDVDRVTDDADFVVIAVPLRRYRDLPLDRLDGHTVIDVMNYWPPIDGILPEFENTDRPSSAVVQDALPNTARLVKTFNHLGYHQMEDLARPTGDAERVALGVASDDTNAAEQAAAFLDAAGFDPVQIGGLDRSGALQPETTIFGAALPASEFEEQLMLSAAQ